MTQQSLVFRKSFRWQGQMFSYRMKCLCGGGEVFVFRGGAFALWKTECLIGSFLFAKMEASKFTTVHSLDLI